MSINQIICDKNDLIENSGVAAMVDGEQIAIFYLPTTEKKIFAISNWDPIGKANILSRGIVGDYEGKIVVSSPLYKQHFDLESGLCLEDEKAPVRTYSVSLKNDKVVMA
ncbi:MAG: nitrite reductase small subunit NirD [Kangiellaceae bacterium]|nr:nitrite reductase small subunit NirD [Kangiellaceae bacterium]